MASELVSVAEQPAGLSGHDCFVKMVYHKLLSLSSAGSPQA